MLISVDPGVKATGVAFFDDYSLVNVLLVRARSLELMIVEMQKFTNFYDTPDTVIVERPTIYRRGGKGDPVGLVSISIVAGAAACSISQDVWSKIKFVEPRVWKGSVPKKIHNERIVEQLNDREQAILKTRLVKAPVKLIHNVIDAVGIGLYQLGKM